MTTGKASRRVQLGKEIAEDEAEDENDRDVDDLCETASQDVPLVQDVVDDVGVHFNTWKNRIERCQDDVEKPESGGADNDDLVLQRFRAGSPLHDVDHRYGLMSSARSVVVHLESSELVRRYDVAADLYLSDSVALQVDDAPMVRRSIAEAVERSSHG